VLRSWRAVKFDVAVCYIQTFFYGYDETSLFVQVENRRDTIDKTLDPLVPYIFWRLCRAEIHISSVMWRYCQTSGSHRLWFEKNNLHSTGVRMKQIYSVWKALARQYPWILVVVFMEGDGSGGEVRQIKKKRGVLLLVCRDVAYKTPFCLTYWGCNLWQTYPFRSLLSNEHTCYHHRVLEVLWVIAITRITMRKIELVTGDRVHVEYK